MIVEDENTVLFKEDEYGNRIFVKLTDTPLKVKTHVTFLTNHTSPAKRTVKHIFEQKYKFSITQEIDYAEFKDQVFKEYRKLNQKKPISQPIKTPVSLQSFFPRFIILLDNFMLHRGLGKRPYDFALGFLGPKILSGPLTFSLNYFDFLRKGLIAKKAWELYETELNEFLILKEDLGSVQKLPKLDIVVTAPTRLKDWFDEEFKEIKEKQKEDINKSEKGEDWVKARILEFEDKYVKRVTKTEKLDQNLTSGRATATEDKPAEIDLLGNESLVRGLAEMFAHEDQKTPLTMALLGNWGGGKTSIMKMVESELKKKSSDRFIFSWFNAWKYESTDNLSAGLAQEVMNSFMAKLSFLKRQVFRLEFALLEHGEKLLWVGFIIPLFIIVGFKGFPFEKLLEEDSKILVILNYLDGFNGAIGGLVAWFVIFYYLIQKWSEHPISTSFNTYLRLPSYGEHLGLIPVLKRHIETMAVFRLGINSVWNKDSRKIRRELYANFLFPFNKLFYCFISLIGTSKNKRLIVFVDDLDRCKPETIVKVLEAARLVMDIKNVILIIGIDNRILFNAVGNYFEKLQDDKRLKEDIARDYLGKIVQIAVTLDRPDEGQIKNYISEALFPDKSIYENKKSPGFDQGRPQKNMTSGDEEAGKTQNENSEGFNDNENEEGQKDGNNLDEDTSDNDDEIMENVLEKEMKFTLDEKELFEKLAEDFGFRNPRQLLRMKNSYSLAKLMYVLSDEKEINNSHLMSLLFWLEFKGQWPKESAQVIESIQQNKTSNESEFDTEAVENKYFEHSDFKVEKVISKLKEFDIDDEEIKGKFTDLYKFVKRFVLPIGEKTVEVKQKEVKTSPN
jgi:Cdc6-like AAA superfamily ATPase